MNFELKKLNLEMGKIEYDMYQDIPNEESGSHNEFYGFPYKDFSEYLKKQIKRENNQLTNEDTLTVTYLLYANNIPVGIICLRTKIDDKWKLWSGNFYYVIRKSERNKGFGSKLLELGLEKFKELGFKEVYGNASEGNLASARVIEKNGGIFIENYYGSKHYKIILDSKVYLKVPRIEDLHYRQKWIKDPLTMEYNAGYDIDLKGYNKETGIINKNDEEMKNWYNNWINKEPNKYFSYI